jgi:hypothetical protein
MRFHGHSTACVSYCLDVDCGLFDGSEPFQPVPRLTTINTAIISAATVALHHIKRDEGSGISGPFAFDDTITA